MSQIVLSMSVSVDGMFEDADGGLGWQIVDAELHGHFNDGMRDAGAFLGGRATYALMEAYWPAVPGDPDATEVETDFAGIWARIPKVVYSRTLESVGPGATLVRSVDVDEVAALRDGAAGDLYLGGADLAATFLRLGLVDVLALYVHPVVLGGGRPLLPEGTAPLTLTLQETRAFGSGVTMLRYSVG